MHKPHVISIPAKTILWFMVHGCSLRSYYYHTYMGSVGRKVCALSTPDRKYCIWVQESAIRSLVKHRLLLAEPWSGGLCVWKVNWNLHLIAWMEIHYPDGVATSDVYYRRLMRMIEYNGEVISYVPVMR